MEFSHVDQSKVRMVDISGKSNQTRIAIAEGRIKLKKNTIAAIVNNEIAKGNVLATANIAAVLAIKKTSELIPMCHNIPITSINVDFSIEEESIEVRCEVKSTGKTGVEMEALVGVSIALLTIWDMVKSLEKDESGQYPHTQINDVKVVSKTKVQTSNFDG
ncbi:cyclic pyranopterin monophosphate synthase MoaC [Archaeoglobales archaeon ex4484_92]|nr:MAG: cyclic pyranopterin monophosphate synthase MoaC [Archaeoglobales archaeon ex4484_92]